MSSILSRRTFLRSLATIPAAAAWPFSLAAKAGASGRELKSDVLIVGGSPGCKGRIYNEGMKAYAFQITSSFTVSGVLPLHGECLRLIARLDLVEVHPPPAIGNGRGGLRLADEKW